MTKFTVKTAPKSRRAASKPDSVSIKRVRNESGATLRIFSVNANSASFGDDFLYAFKQNVRRARRENKACLGTTSGAESGA